MSEKDGRRMRSTDESASPGGLLEADEDPRELIGLLVHELRNPLGIAMGRLELAREDCDSDHLDSVARALDRMDALVDDFGAITATGRIVEELRPVELRHVVKVSWENVSSAGGSLEVDTTCRVRADPSRLQQVMENLLRNAVEHGSTSSQPEADDAVEPCSTSPHSPSEDVTITVGELPGEPGFYVEDDGPGIPPEDRETVFERGYTTGGTGFGLWIVNTFVDAHGWTITVTEGESGGTRFEVSGVELAR